MRVIQQSYTGVSYSGIKQHELFFFFCPSVACFTFFFFSFLCTTQPDAHSLSIELQISCSFSFTLRLFLSSPRSLWTPVVEAGDVSLFRALRQERQKAGDNSACRTHTITLHVCSFPPSLHLCVCRCASWIKDKWLWLRECFFSVDPCLTFFCCSTLDTVRECSF